MISRRGLFKIVAGALLAACGFKESRQKTAASSEYFTIDGEDAVTATSSGLGDKDFACWAYYEPDTGRFEMGWMDPDTWGPLT